MKATVLMITRSPAHNTLLSCPSAAGAHANKGDSDAATGTGDDGSAERRSKARQGAVRRAARPICRGVAALRRPGAAGAAARRSEAKSAACPAPASAKKKSGGKVGGHSVGQQFTTATASAAAAR